MEQYLKEQYGVFEDKWLTQESEIEGYFKDSGSNFLECGQGYAEEEGELLCKIEDKFYKVNIKAEIGSEKQDIGDRLYWVENITDVTYVEIEKPLPKDESIYTYELSLTNHQKVALEFFMRENYIKY